MEPIVDVQNVMHLFQQHRALDGVSFQIRPGSLHGFVGPNGAGKTTTLKLICTLLKPQSGRITVFGLDVRKDVLGIRKRLGYMPDHFSMYRQMTVYEYLDFFAAAHGSKAAERKRIVDELLELTDMGNRRYDLIQGLSRGLQQRVSLARVLVNNPDLLLLDEPASGLDPRARLELMEILRELRRMGKTIIISSHILTELSDLCDSVTVIDQGKTKYSGLMETLLDRGTDQPIFRVRLACSPDEQKNGLLDIAGVLSVDPVESRSEVRVTLNPLHLDGNCLLRILLEREFTVISFSREQRQLNEAFMDLTQREVRK